MAQAEKFNLKRGQRIRARVEDVVSADVVIVSFQGKLVRVANTTANKIQRDDVLDLQVVGIQPLEFRFYVKTRAFERLV